ncbi:hypothetical protein [Rhodococcus sp. IEGM 1379]|uniref:hypothetical protein n=1 Tax=Rhodococcus sp. IEGM 1379 TaxID=3047086 RepID=UPI0024B6403A|nr:hypothetical protein [Rhodococcus sp. IEGM 1379]MDI9917879.1 hypothetical protein [Rhodococcus sp. IEGM 1379]
MNLIVLATATMRGESVILALRVAGSVSYTSGAVLGHILLRKRYGLLGFHQVGETFGRIAAAAALAGGCALAAVLVVQGRVEEPRVAAAVALSAGLTVGTAILLTACKVVGVPEIRHARTLLRL